MIKAYVLIVTDPGTTRQTVEMLRALDHVSSAHEVMGPYDIVLEMETEHLTEVPRILSEQVRTLDGIQSTTSLVAFTDLEPSQS